MEQPTKEEWILIRAMCTLFYPRMLASPTEKTLDALWSKAIHETKSAREGDTPERHLFLRMLAALHDVAD